MVDLGPIWIGDRCRKMQQDGILIGCFRILYGRREYQRIAAVIHDYAATTPFQLLFVAPSS